MHQKPKTALLLLCCAGLLTACKTTASASHGIYSIQEWPSKPQGAYTQRDVAEYIVKGKSAYDSCKASISILQGKGL